MPNDKKGAEAMAEAKKTESTTTANAPAVSEAHDRVAMLRLRADGTPDQLNPEIIGDPQFAEQAAKRQFTEQAVSALDYERRAVDPAAVTIIGKPGDEPDEIVPLRTEADPATEELRKAQEHVAKAAEARAEETMRALRRER
jgi:hypothetical protein